MRDDNPIATGREMGYEMWLVALILVLFSYIASFI